MEIISTSYRRRILANLIDTLAISLPLLAAFPVIWQLGNSGNPAIGLAAWSSLYLLVPICYVVHWLLSTFQLLIGRQSVGYQVMDLVVVATDGQSVTWRRVLLRQFLAGVLVLVPLMTWLPPLLFISPTWSLIDSPGRTLRDRLSGTWVVAAAQQHEMLRLRSLPGPEE